MNKENGTNVPTGRDNTYDKTEVHRKSIEELFETSFNENQKKALLGMDIGGGGGSGSGTGGKALKGKKVSILGDSISAYPGYVTPSTNAVFYPSGNHSPKCDVKSVDDMWWKIVLDKAGMVLGANNAYSGRTLKNSATTANVEALGANGDPDIILVYLGTNDANQQITLGTLNTSVPFNVDSSEVSGDETKGTDLSKDQIDALGNSTFYESVRTLILRLQWYYPAAKIVFILVGFGSYARFYANNPYRKATIEVCDMLGVDYIDTRKAGLHMPRLNKYIFQRVHPNKAGMKLIGEYVYNKLVSLYGNYIAEIEGGIPEDVSLSSITYTGSLTKEQFEGIPFDPTGLTFTANFSDGTSIEVDAADISFSPATLARTTAAVTPSYTVNGVTKSGTPITVNTTPTVITSGNFRFAIRNSFSEMKAISSAAISMAGGNLDGTTMPQADKIRYMSDARAKRRLACAITPANSDSTVGVHPAINGEILAVTGGSTIHLTTKPSGFTHPVAWSMMEMDSNLQYVTGGIRAEQWLEGDRTLQANTAYVQISFKPKADTTSSSVSFNNTEIAALPAAALSIQ